jgi:hypothetical protein
MSRNKGKEPAISTNPETQNASSTPTPSVQLPSSVQELVYYDICKCRWEMESNKSTGLKATRERLREALTGHVKKDKFLEQHIKNRDIVSYFVVTIFTNSRLITR